MKLTIGALVYAYDLSARIDIEVGVIDSARYIDSCEAPLTQQKAMQPAVGTQVHSHYLALRVNARRGVFEEGTRTRRIKRVEGTFGSQKNMSLTVSALVISRNVALRIISAAVGEYGARRVK